MSEVTLTAVVDETHVLHIELPHEIVGEVEVSIREKSPRGSAAALWRAVREAPRADDSTVWQRAREELACSREED